LKVIQKQGYSVASIHGDKSQSERDFVLQTFRNGKTAILVATDVAARGLDVDLLKYVINFDYPNSSEDYVHRIGRTGRCEQLGSAFTFFTPNNARQARELIAVLEENGQRPPPELVNLANSVGHKKGIVRSNYRQYGQPIDEYHSGFNKYNNRGPPQQYQTRPAGPQYNKFGGPPPHYQNAYNNGAGQRRPGGNFQTPNPKYAGNNGNFQPRPQQQYYNRRQDGEEGGYQPRQNREGGQRDYNNRGGYHGNQQQATAVYAQPPPAGQVQGQQGNYLVDMFEDLNIYHQRLSPSMQVPPPPIAGIAAPGGAAIYQSYPMQAPPQPYSFQYA
jgi:ATP-dependent RNA helicase DDX5/DBP2